MPIVQVAFSRSSFPTAIGSRIIQAGEDRPFSHAFVIFQDPRSGETLIFQASHGMVHLVPMDRFLESNIIVKKYSISVSEEECDKIWKFMVRRLGTPYSRYALIVLGLMKCIGLKDFIRLDGDKTYICSELAAEFCKLESIQVPENIDIVTPSDLDLMLDKAQIPCQWVEPNL